MTETQENICKALLTGKKLRVAKRQLYGLGLKTAQERKQYFKEASQLAKIGILYSAVDKGIQWIEIAS